MMNNIKISLIFVSIMWLSGCEQAVLTEDYLLEHVSVLELEIKKCATLPATTPVQVEHCRMVDHARSVFMSYDAAYRAHPSDFGMKVMQLEIQLADLHESIVSLEQRVDILQRQQTDQPALNETKHKLDQAIRDFKQKQHELNIMLQVIAQYSPL